MTMTSPVRCWSSIATTHLLTWRNPQGGEENWLEGAQNIDHPFTYLGKVVTTEIGVALLCVTSIVETVVYGGCFVGSLPFLSNAWRPFIFDTSLMSSASFTLYWNLGNLVVFNPLCSNAITHESFARFSCDHWPRGQVFKTVVKVAYVILQFFCALTIKTSIRKWPNIDHYLNAPSTRTQDSVYIAIWTIMHGLTNSAMGVEVHPLLQHGREGHVKIKEGVAFFRDFILKEGQIATESRDLVLESDADIFHFITTRSVYLYVLGSEKEKEIPQFFKAETQIEIAKLRGKKLLDPKGSLEMYVKNHTKFGEEPADEQVRQLLNQFKMAGYKEIQGSQSFVGECWGQACDAFVKEQRGDKRS
jgi:hypothetical protein